MTRARRLILGTIATAGIACVTAVLSAWPAYQALPEGAGLLKLSFTHGAERSCRTLTDDELVKLPVNMRRKEVCDRRRPPVYVELDIDSETRLRVTLPPTGVAGDGPSRIYERIVLPAGPHDIAVRLRDTARADGFDHTGAQHLSLAPGGNAVIDFRADAGGFIFHFGTPRDGEGGDDDA
jgi:hypothetical protein